MLEEELAGLLAQQIAERPWPNVGETVVIASDWDGPTLHGSDMFLVLRSGDRVKISEKSHDGLLRGTVLGKGPSRPTGWFGGAGCTANKEITLTVPLAGSAPLGAEGIGGPDGPGPASNGWADVEGGAEGSIDDASLLQDVEAYLERNRINSSAAKVLREADYEVARIVVEKDLSNCRNPSAVLLSRIERVKADVANGGAASPPRAPASRLAARERSRSPRRARDSEDVEDFIRQEALDDRASNELRALTEDQQRQVIDSYTGNARNPSAVVYSKIQSVKARVETANAAEDYIARNGIDEECAGRLRELAPELQEQIVQTDLVNCRNPSAVLLSRIKQIEAQASQLERGGARATPVLGQPPPPMTPPPSYGYAHFSQGPYPMVAASRMPAPPRAPLPPGGFLSRASMHPPLGPPLGAAVEDYIRRYGLDDRVATELRALPFQDQERVIESAPTNARNPSAIVSSRIAAMRSQMHAPPSHVASADQQAVEAYLVRHPVDEAAASALRELPPDFQQQVMEKDLSNCRNASAVLLSRIKAVTTGRR